MTPKQAVEIQQSVWLSEPLLRVTEEYLDEVKDMTRGSVRFPDDSWCPCRTHRWLRSIQNTGTAIWTHRRRSKCTK